MMWVPFQKKKNCPYQYHENCKSIASLGNNHFFSSHEHNVAFRSDTVGRN